MPNYKHILFNFGIIIFGFVPYTHLLRLTKAMAAFVLFCQSHNFIRPDHHAQWPEKISKSPGQ
jgi:hypothetical protein